ncbi:MAG TPA: pyridoxal phosphate-dependent aminotransferase, partial [Tepidisphaeraceae bacterium]|nr:pyridoxal phosphate-dependent aminotransferase [Tepidisphaeraceae bacterium]
DFRLRRNTAGGGCATIILDADVTISQRMLRVQAPMIPLVGEMVKRNPGTISLGQGVVHYGPPSSVARAVAEAASNSRVHRYGLAFGIEPLLERVRSKLEAENGIRVGHDRRIAVTAGSNMGFQTAVLAIADPGDQIILLSPFYFNHEMAIDIASCKTVAVPTNENYQPDVNAIASAITSRTRAVVTISPNNPTGAVYPESALRQINALCRDRGIYHIHDEAYEYFTYGATPHFSPASLPGSEPHTISLFSLSKNYGMAGWRIGYMVIPAHLEEAIKKIQDTNLICPPMINQFAAVAALDAGRAWCEPRVQGIAAVRKRVLGKLRTLGERVRIPEPGGAFYVLARIHSERRDMDLVEALIRDFRVAVMPGSTFGIQDGCCLRIAYAALEEQTVAEGIGRLVRGLHALI